MPLGRIATCRAAATTKSRTSDASNSSRINRRTLPAWSRFQAASIGSGTSDGQPGKALAGKQSPLVGVSDKCLIDEDTVTVLPRRLSER